MQKIKPQESRLKVETKLSDEFLDLKTLDSNIIVSHLEHSLKLREMPLNERLKKGMLR